MKIAFRVDASPRMGLGHLQRCLSLAQALRGCGADILFVTRELGVGSASIVEAAGLATACLPAADEALALDADQTLAALDGFRPDGLVVDHYALHAPWHTRLRSAARSIMVIDDLADRSLDCDVLLDQNLPAVAARYEGLVPPHCKVLVGPRFALLRPEFAKLRAATAPREGLARRVLVFMGGGDVRNVTGRVLDALLAAPPFCAHPERPTSVRPEPPTSVRPEPVEGLGPPAQPPVSTDSIGTLRQAQGERHFRLTVDVVLSRGSPHESSVRAACAATPGCTLHLQTPDMAGLMARADLMIGASGSTTWERCCLGLPALLLSIADNQRGVGREAARHRFAVYLGDDGVCPQAHLQSVLHRLLRRPTLLRRLGQRALQVTDGHGAERVAAALSDALCLAVN